MSLEVLQAWPEIPPDERVKGPKTLYIAESISGALRAQLESKGWKVVDVRLLSGSESVRGTLEGVRLGSIQPPKGQNWLRSVELEARVYKLLSDKGETPEKDEKVLDSESVEALLSFSKSEVTNTPAIIAKPEPLALVKRKGGRPKGAKDLKPRKKTGDVRGVALVTKLEKINREREFLGLVPVSSLKELEEKKDMELAGLF